MNYIYKTKFQKFIEILFVIFTILQCNSIYLYKVGPNKLIIDVVWQILLLLLFMYSCSCIKYKDNNILNVFIIIFASIMIIFFITEYVWYPSFHKSYIYRLLIDPLLLVTYFYTYYKTKTNTSNENSVFYIFEDIIIIIGIISFFFWILAVNGVPTNSILLVSGWYKSKEITPISSFFNIDFVINISRVKLFGLDILRNTGIFVEPSMYSYSIGVAISIELFLRKNTNIFNLKLIILFIVMLSTFSTTGIVFSTLAILYEIFVKKQNSYSSKYFLLMLVPVLFLFLKSVIFNKIDLGSDPNSSYAIRMNDIEASIDAWKDHILLGNGLGNMNSITNHIGSWRILTNNTGISTGFTTILACGGILFSLFYILPFIFSLTLSPEIIGFYIFIILPIIFVSVQDSYLCIIVISYVWSYYLFEHPYNMHGAS